MKVVNAIVKVLIALAAVAGAVYLIATYGEEIVAWAKKVWNSLSKCPKCCGTGGDEEAPAEEAELAEEAVPAEEPAPEAPAVEDGAVVADDSDFEG